MLYTLLAIVAFAAVDPPPISQELAKTALERYEDLQAANAPVVIAAAEKDLEKAKATAKAELKEAARKGGSAKDWKVIRDRIQQQVKEAEDSLAKAKRGEYGPPKLFSSTDTERGDLGTITNEDGPRKNGTTYSVMIVDESGDTWVEGHFKWYSISSPVVANGHYYPGSTSTSIGEDFVIFGMDASKTSKNMPLNRKDVSDTNSLFINVGKIAYEGRMVFGFVKVTLEELRNIANSTTKIDTNAEKKDQ